MSDYSKHYKDSRWQQKRLEIMERDNWTCRSCGASGEGVTLNVHHAYYEKGKKPWEYENKMLITWCEKCHKERHSMNKDILLGLCFADEENYNVLYDLVGSSLAQSRGVMVLVGELVNLVECEIYDAYTEGRTGGKS